MTTLATRRHVTRGAALRLTTAAGLAVDAVVHAQLASSYQLAAPGGIGQGNLFRVEAVVAGLAAVYVLVRGTRSAYLVALAVALGGLAAILLYRYVDVPAFGPIPSMYEPLWFAKKEISAVAQAFAGAAALIGLSRKRQSEPAR
ncbi:hypothetical protein ACSMXN_08715 [Jatrophihabitans sp. DSM 45814]